MAAPAKPRSLFGDQLRQQLDTHQTIRSVRRLSQVMADGQQHKAESYRRLLGKWIAGDSRPTIGSRYLVAQALEVDVAVFADGDDDEEEAELMDDLTLVLRRLIRRELERTTA